MRRDGYMDTKEVAALLGCTPMTARYHMARSGAATEGYVCPHCGTRSQSLLVDREAFTNYLKKREQEG